MAAFQHPNIETMTLDVQSDEQAKAVVASIIDKEGRIDVLVNNAGAMCIGKSSNLNSTVYILRK
jgi:1-acylglycerone phosphate reductase